MFLVYNRFIQTTDEIVVLFGCRQLLDIVRHVI